MLNIRILIVFILFSCFANGQIIDSYRFGPSCPAGFFLDNVVTPSPCEQNDTDGWEETLQTANVTMAIESSDVQNGSFAIKVTCDTDITTNGGIRLAFTGLTIGVTYTVTYWIKRSAAVNVITDLSTSQGWTTPGDSNTTGASADSWFQETLTAEASATTAYFRLYGGTTFDAGEILMADNITITAVP